LSRRTRLAPAGASPAACSAADVPQNKNEKIEKEAFRHPTKLQIDKSNQEQSMSSPGKRLKTIFRAVRGANGTEYAIILLVVGVGSMVAIIAAGKTQLGDYEESRDLVLVPAI
jgi:hypothetical protein